MGALFQLGRGCGSLKCKKLIFKKPGLPPNQVVSFQRYDFLHTQSRIQLSVIVAKFYSMHEAQFRFAIKL